MPRQNLDNMETLRKRLTHSVTQRDPDRGTPIEDFVFTYELVPARASRSEIIDKTLNFANQAAKDGKITALSITDNAGGHPALTPTALGQEIKNLGIEPVIHFSCKDKNRNLIESQLFELDRTGLNTLLVITGDYPRYGFKGRAKPVYDLDSVLVLCMIEEIRKGLIINSKAPGGGVKLTPMSFHAGCVVSPFKLTEAEQVQQYLKLKRKIKAGADFIITQMGFDVRKYHELRLLLDLLGIKIPLIGTVFIPDARLARIINKGIIPGCTMPNRLLSAITAECEGPDRGMTHMLDRAAKMVAILAGMGYQGAHLSGPGLEYEHIRQVMEKAEKLFPNWRELVDELLFPEEWPFWLFEQDEETGLNRSPHRQKAAAQSPNAHGSLNIRKKKGGRPLALSPRYLLGLAIHYLFFEPDGPFFDVILKLLTSVKNKRTIKSIARFEYFFKTFLYDCYRCGDCYLPDTGLLCPQSQCAKRLVNGPCGGSHNGWCEVWNGEKRCLYVRQYDRLEDVEKMLFQDIEILLPRDWGLDGTSSWINFFTGKDHHRVDFRKLKEKA